MNVSVVGACTPLRDSCMSMACASPSGRRLLAGGILPDRRLPLQVVIRGQVCKVVGYGGMNMHMIDITSIPDAQVKNYLPQYGPLHFKETLLGLNGLINCSCH